MLNEQRVTQQAEVILLNKELKLTRGSIDYGEALGDEPPHLDFVAFHLHDSAGNLCGRWSGTYEQFKSYCGYIQWLKESRPSTNVRLSRHYPTGDIRAEEAILIEAIYDEGTSLGVWYGTSMERAEILGRTGWQLEPREG